MTRPPVSPAAAVAKVRALAADRTVFVGVDGLGGAGKSTLANLIAAAEPRAVVVPTDDLHGPGVTEWDWRRLSSQVVDPLLAGRDGRYEVWNWDEPAGRGWRLVPPGSLVVIEGVSATRTELAVPWDLKIWVTAPWEVRRQRTAARDGPVARHLWRDHWWPSEAAYLARDRPVERADLIVDGTAPN